MPWDGKERREAEASTVGRVTGDIVEPTLSKRAVRKLRRKYRWNVFLDQLFEKRYILAVITMTQFLLLGLMAYGIANTNNKAARGINETQNVSQFIKQFVIVSAKAGATRNNNMAEGMDCQTQLFITPAEKRTQPQVDRCREFFKQAIQPAPTEEQIKAFLKQIEQEGKN